MDFVDFCMSGRSWRFWELEKAKVVERTAAEAADAIDCLNDGLSFLIDTPATPCDWEPGFALTGACIAKRWKMSQMVNPQTLMLAIRWDCYYYCTNLL